MSNVVRNYSGKVIAKGGTISVYGSCFTNLTRGWLGDEELVVKDYEYGFVEFAGLSTVGQYVLYVGTSVENRQEVGPVVIRELTGLHLYRLKKPTLNEARDMMLGLLPRGFAWYKGLDGNFAKLSRGLSRVICEIYQLVISYQNAVSPSHTDSFEDWENELALPEKGVVSNTDGFRREEIFRKDCRKGGCTIPYFKSIALLFGKKINIYEYYLNPEKFEDVDFGDDDPNFYWMIELEANSSDIHICTCNDTCNDYLRTWWNAPIEAMFDAIKPAHTKLVYNYTNDFQELVLVDDNENVIETPTRAITVAVRSGEVVNPGTAVIDGHTVQTIRIKDLPDAQDDRGYAVLDSETGGTVKAEKIDAATVDELWDEIENNG